MCCTCFNKQSTSQINDCFQIPLLVLPFKRLFQQERSLVFTWSQSANQPRGHLDSYEPRCFDLSVNMRSAHYLDVESSKQPNCRCSDYQESKFRTYANTLRLISDTYNQVIATNPFAHLLYRQVFFCTLICNCRLAKLLKVPYCIFLHYLG